MGRALAHEIRCKGRALYVLRLDGNPFETKVISGFDTKKNSPMELIIKTDTTELNSNNPYSQTMYICYWHDYIVNFKADGIETYG